MIRSVHPDDFKTWQIKLITRSFLIDNLFTVKLNPNQII